MKTPDLKSLPVSRRSADPFGQGGPGMLCLAKHSCRARRPAARIPSPWPHGHEHAEPGWPGCSRASSGVSSPISLPWVLLPRPFQLTEENSLEQFLGMSPNPGRPAPLRHSLLCQASSGTQAASTSHTSSSAASPVQPGEPPPHHKQCRDSGHSGPGWDPRSS